MISLSRFTRWNSSSIVMKLSWHFNSEIILGLHCPFTNKYTRWQSISNFSSTFAYFSSFLFTGWGDYLERLLLRNLMYHLLEDPSVLVSLVLLVFLVSLLNLLLSIPLFMCTSLPLLLIALSLYVHSCLLDFYQWHTPVLIWVDVPLGFLLYLFHHSLDNFFSNVSTSLFSTLGSTMVLVLNLVQVRKLIDYAPF